MSLTYQTNMYKSIIAVIFYLFISQSVTAQIEMEVYPPEFIKSIAVKSESNQVEFPVIRLGNSFSLEFDVLNGYEEDYYYKIDHYNFDWKKSQLSKSEYLKGYDNNKIYNYKNSFNTYQIYSHYELSIPNTETKVIKSGNYIISIFNEYEEIVFSKKIIIYEALSSVKIGVFRTRDLNFINKRQVVQFEIEAEKINNPMKTIKTLIIQNNNLKQSISNLKPQYTIGNKLIYKYDLKASFMGGNEFLYFENKNIRGSDINIRTFDLKEIYHNYLYPDIPRNNSTYSYNPDINGNFLVTAVDAEDTDIEADYAVVHFYLNIDKLDSDKSIYVSGNFNGYQLNSSNKMTYNSLKKNYELELKLKQGFYNYKYSVLNNFNKEIDGFVSGNFDETENNYKVIIYYSDFGSRYDRVIGYNQINSINLNN
ncbi:DUF5103 domain-containing protein [Flavobacteriaceae bacterium]|nr:DUF5103 domain-containing protein [Flavobacteriaceae bacterium]MDC1492527.1 DUF5103 domain-containing protein [Flavobacteriaceae bacterium]